MYLAFTGKRQATARRTDGRKTSLNTVVYFPILIPVGFGSPAVFYQDEDKSTKVRIYDQVFELVESIERVMNLISDNGVKVSNEEVIKNFFPEEGVV
jgi:hypothetical protein